MGGLQKIDKALSRTSRCDCINIWRRSLGKLDSGGLSSNFFFLSRWSFLQNRLRLRLEVRFKHLHSHYKYGGI